MRKILIAFGLIAGSFFAVQAQTIRISFPHFAGAEYDVYIYHGVTMDTIAGGMLDSLGVTRIEIPPACRNRTGFFCWRLKQGGGLDFIVDGQDMEITCAEAEPNDDNIFYTPAVEQNFHLHNFRNQQQLLDKAGALQYLLEVYRNDSSVFTTALQEEYIRIRSDYVALHSRLETSGSYAAHYLLTQNLFDGTGSRIFDPGSCEKVVLNLLMYSSFAKILLS
jgi:hypothetical protein